jgi:hypothetical protein
VIIFLRILTFGTRGDFSTGFRPGQHRKLSAKSKKNQEEIMKRIWLAYGAAALLLLAGCGKSNDNANQANAPNVNSASDQAAPGQPSATNPATAQTEPPAPPPEPPKPLVVPVGTSIPVILSTTINSHKNKPGEEFGASVAAAAVVDGEVAIPKGARVTGVIVTAKKQGAVKGEAEMSIKLTSVTVHGKNYLIATNSYSGTEKGKGKRSAVMTGGGAAVGALIGGLAGGGKGAAIGAGIGAGGGLATAAGTGGKNVEFPAESRITFKLSQPLTIDR